MILFVKIKQEKGIRLTITDCLTHTKIHYIPMHFKFGFKYLNVVVFNKIFNINAILTIILKKTKKGHLLLNESTEKRLLN